MLIMSYLTKIKNQVRIYKEIDSNYFDSFIN